MEISVIQLVTDLIIALLLGMGYVVYKFQNFMVNWYKVKRSKGSKLLVEVENPIQDYFAVGSYDNGFLRYKARKRRDNPDPHRMISVDDVDAVVYNKFGIKCIRVDDAKCCVRSRRVDKMLPGYNAEKTDAVVQTAMMKPDPNAKGLFDEKTWQVIVLIAFVLVIIVGIVCASSSMTTDKHVLMVYNMLVNGTYAPPITV